MKCESAGKCGFYQWLLNERKDLVDKTGCGKFPYGCGRLNPSVPHRLDHYGPITMDEGIYAFPDRPNENGRESRSGVGSCAQWGDLFEGADNNQYVEG